MSKQLFTIEEAKDMTTDTLMWFEEIRNGKAGDWVMFDNHDLKGLETITKYEKVLNLLFHGCIMDHYGYTLTERTDTSLLPDVSDIVKERWNEYKKSNRELNGKPMSGISTNEMLNIIKEKYESKHVSKM